MYNMGLCYMSVLNAERFKYGAILTTDAQSICQDYAAPDTEYPEEQFMNLLVYLPTEIRFAIAHQPQNFIKYVPKLLQFIFPLFF